MQIDSKPRLIGISTLKNIASVYSNWKYIVLSIIVTTIFWTAFNILDQRLFFSPVLAFYVPVSTLAGFVLSSIVAGLLGISASMNVYAWRSSRGTLNKEGPFSLLSNSFVCALATVCAACTPQIGTFLVIILGGSAAIALYSFMSHYQVLILAISLLLLSWSIYSAGNGLSKVRPVRSTRF